MVGGTHGQESRGGGSEARHEGAIHTESEVLTEQRLLAWWSWSASRGRLKRPGGAHTRRGKATANGWRRTRQSSYCSGGRRAAAAAGQRFLRAPAIEFPTALFLLPTEYIVRRIPALLPPPLPARPPAPRTSHELQRTGYELRAAAPPALAYLETGERPPVGQCCGRQWSSRLIASLSNASSGRYRYWIRGACLRTRGVLGRIIHPQRAFGSLRASPMAGQRGDPKTAVLCICTSAAHPSRVASLYPCPARSTCAGIIGGTCREASCTCSSDEAAPSWSGFSRRSAHPSTSLVT